MPADNHEAIESTRDRLRKHAQTIISYGTPTGVVLGMALAACGFYLALKYMPGMKLMAAEGWSIAETASKHYDRIHWTPDSIRYTAVGLLKLVSGTVLYIALVIPAVLSALSFWRGGVRLIKLIAGR